MTQGFDVVIAGAGIVGSACAHECARRGLKVALLDRTGPGDGATAAGMGHLVVMDDSEALFALTRYSRQLWEALRSELPAAAEYLACGTLWIAADGEEMEEVETKRAFLAQREVETEVLDAPALAAAEPRLRPGLAGGLRVPGDAVIYPPAAAAWFAAQAHALGAELRFGQAVVTLGSGEARLADGSRVTAAKVVNATGAAAPILTPGLPIKGRKGHLVITDRYPGFIQHQLVELGYKKSAHSQSADSVAFNLQPRRTGQLLIGSSRQYGATSGAVDEAMVARMLRRAAEFVPALGALSALRVWTGFRAATPDQLPLIGPWPGREPSDPTLFVATGHEGLGITTALATAQLLADQLTGARSAIPAAPYLPARLGVAS